MGRYVESIQRFDPVLVDGDELGPSYQLAVVLKLDICIEFYTETIAVEVPAGKIIGAQFKRSKYQAFVPRPDTGANRSV